MRIVIYIIIFLSLINCGSPKIENEDIIGIWHSKDGSNITFFKEHNCVLKNVDFYILSPFKNNKSIKLNTSNATWSINKDNSSVHLSYKLPNRNGMGGIDFYFEKTKIKNSIYIWIGDPDDTIKYEYTKEK